MRNVRGSLKRWLLKCWDRPSWISTMYNLLFFVANINKNEPTKLQRSNERTCCEGITHCPVLYLFLNLVCHWMGKTVTSIVQQNSRSDSAVCCCGNAPLLSHVAVQRLNSWNFNATKWINGHLKSNKNLTPVFSPASRFPSRYLKFEIIPEGDGKL